MTLRNTAIPLQKPEQCLINAPSAQYASNNEKKGQQVSTDFKPCSPMPSLSNFPRGTDLAPPGAGDGTKLSTEGIPKSVSRVLDAARIRAEYRAKKRARVLEEGDTRHGDADDPTLPKAKKRRHVVAEDSDAGKSTKASEKATGIEIQPGESLRHFNRCASLL